MNTNNKLVVCCDVDGVLADLVTPLCDEIRRLVPDSSIRPQDIGHHEFGKSLTDHELATAVKVMGQPGFADSLPWYDGAKDFARELSEKYDLVFLTAYFDDSATWCEERKQWLRAVVPNAKPVLCPSKYKKLFGGSFLIEDHPGTLADWTDENEFGEGILIDCPWNAPGSDGFDPHNPFITRAYSYSHALDLIAALAENWKMVA